MTGTDQNRTHPDDRSLLALTVDVEEWYAGMADRPGDVATYPSRLEEGLSRLLDLLDATGTRATFFVLGYLAREHPGLIRRVADAGHEMGIHDDYHLPLWDRNEKDFRESVTRALESVEQCVGAPAGRYRAPCFSVDRRTIWALDVLEDLGFSFDSSVFPVRNPRYGFPGAPRFPYRAKPGGQLVEFPLSTIRIGPVNLPFSGGFYLRALPTTVVEAGFRRLQTLGLPAVAYIHPWELDPDQPRIAGGLSYWLRHRVQLGRAPAKLEALLRRFRFTTMGNVIETLGV